MAELKVGDIVRLKSGSGAMTVVKVGDETYRGHVQCKWSTGTDFKSDWFACESLELVER